MPFKSKNQMKAAFGGYLGPEMKKKAKRWADETPNIASLPEQVGESSPKAKPPSSMLVTTRTIKGQNGMPDKYITVRRRK